MSADNWTICPRCKIAHDKGVDLSIQAAASAYGKVPVEDYLALRAAAQNPLEQETNFREDYELGVDFNGSFSVSYTGSCSKCGLKFSYKHEETLANLNDSIVPKGKQK